MHTRTCPNFPPFLLLLFLSFYSLFLPFFYFCLLTLTISFFAATYLHSSILPFIFNGLLILLFIHFCCYIHFFRSIFFIFQTSSSCYRRILFFPFFVIFPFFFFFFLSSSRSVFFFFFLSPRIFQTVQSLEHFDCVPINCPNSRHRENRTQVRAPAWAQEHCKMVRSSFA